MKKRFTEEEVIGILREAEGASRSATCADDTTSPSRRFFGGDGDMAGSRCPTPAPSSPISGIQKSIEHINSLCSVAKDASTSPQTLSSLILQGYEPLLPESWAYSEALLKRSSELGKVTALVTCSTCPHRHRITHPNTAAPPRPPSGRSRIDQSLVLGLPHLRRD